jgi:methionyl-tRNA formyltransferase
MRIVFFGSGAFGLPTLRALVEVHDVALVVSQPERPAGRGRRARPTPLATFAAGAGLVVLTPLRPEEPQIAEAVVRADPDALVVIAYGHKLGAALLEGRFAINLHASLLPKYRGAAPINWAVIHGEKRTGLSVITLADRIDAGLILAQVSTPIDPMETAGELHDRLAEMGPEIVLETLAAHQTGTLRGSPQDSTLVTYARKLTRADGTVSFGQPAAAVRNRVHGLTPWPGCHVRLAGRDLRLHRVQLVNEDPQDTEPGTLLDDALVVCARGLVRLLAVQPAGGKLMSFDAYRCGHDVQPASRFSSP